MKAIKRMVIVNVARINKNKILIDQVKTKNLSLSPYSMIMKVEMTKTSITTILRLNNRILRNRGLKLQVNLKGSKSRLP